MWMLVWSQAKSFTTGGKKLPIKGTQIRHYGASVNCVLITLRQRPSIQLRFISANWIPLFKINNVFFFLFSCGASWLWDIGEVSAANSSSDGRKPAQKNQRGADPDRRVWAGAQFRDQMPVVSQYRRSSTGGSTFTRYKRSSDHRQKQLWESSPHHKSFESLNKSSVNWGSKLY